MKNGNHLKPIIYGLINDREGADTEYLANQLSVSRTTIHKWCKQLESEQRIIIVPAYKGRGSYKFFTVEYVDNLFL